MKLVENSWKNANIISRLLFCWMIPLFRIGLKRDLETDDLGKPLESDESKILGDKLEKNWLHEVKVCKEKNRTPNLKKVLVKTFISQYIIDGILIFIQYVGCKTFQPLLLAMLLAQLKGNGTWKDETYATHLAGGVVFLSLGTVFLNHHTTLRQQQLGMRIRIACCSIVYRKILRLNKLSFNKIAAGQVINIMSNDVTRFDSVLKFLHVLWAAPIQIVLSFFLYSKKISPLTFIGVVCVIIPIIPLQTFISKILGKLRFLIAQRTDERVKKMDETICGIQAIKMYAWEIPFENLILQARKNEIKYLKRAAYFRGVNASFLMFIQRMSLYVTLLGHVVLGYPVDASTVYPLFQFYYMLQVLLAYVYPYAISTLMETLVSIKRIEEFLLLEEKEFFYLSINGIEKIKKSQERKKGYDTFSKHVSRGDKRAPVEGIVNDGYQNDEKSVESFSKVAFGSLDIETPAIEMKEVSASWFKETNTNNVILKNISHKFKPGKLCAIIGSIGSGKSTLLQLILREITPAKGSVIINGKISYASQEPWLFLASVKDNILFGLPYNHKKYREAVRVCALEKDFQQLPNGEQTLVGDRGVSLSGGQKARINLARAVYRQADIYLLDDPLSGLDVHVGTFLFQECFCNYLKGSTRIIVTHQLQHLKAADEIIVLNNGIIENRGSYDELVNSGLDLSESLNPLLTNVCEEGDSSILVTNSIRDISRRISIASTIKSEYEDEEQAIQEEESEEKASGGIKWSVYYKYWTAGRGVCFLFTMVITIVLSHLSASLSDYWLTYWTNHQTFLHEDLLKSVYLTAADNNLDSVYALFTYPDISKTSQFSNTSAASFATLKLNSFSETIKSLFGPLSSMDYIYVYSVLIFFCISLSITGCILFHISCMNSSQGLHNQMLNAILKAPMSFYDKNPSGRILNRFSKDLGNIDESLPRDMLEALQTIMFMISALVMVIITNAWFMIPILIFITIAYVLLIIYLRTAQDVKRLEGITRSPVFSHTCTTMKGICTIRSSNSQAQQSHEFDSLQDIHTASWYQFLASRATLGFWLDSTGVVFTACVMYSFIYYKNGESLSGDIGLAISQTLTLCSMLQFGVRQLTEVVSHFTSCERLIQYTTIEQESGFFKATSGKDWPSSGAIQFKHVNLRYSDKFKPVLENFNININGGWKIGIVGRTGAGKSSLIAALFRMANLEGNIAIDDTNTDTVPLQELRSKISIIPQAPFLFSSSIRYNLDPFGKYDDFDLWNALDAVYLKDILPSLEYKVSEGGSNFSVGQRQLVCLARAILQKNKILVLDEATANMDPQTDQFIQQIIREKFSHCTVLTIAHRLNNIIDADRVLVMDGGKCLEFKHPFLLLKDPRSVLSLMVDETGFEMSCKLRILAKDAYVRTHSHHEMENTV